VGINIQRNLFSREEIIIGERGAIRGTDCADSSGGCHRSNLYDGRAGLPSSMDRPVDSLQKLLCGSAHRTIVMTLILFGQSIQNPLPAQARVLF